MIYEISLLDYSWDLFVASLLIPFIVFQLFLRSIEIDKKSKLKIIVPYLVIWCFFVVLPLISHIYVNASYWNHGYAIAKGVLYNIIEDRRYLVLQGDSFYLRYSTVSGKCLTKKPEIKERSKVEIKYVFDENDACILSIRKLEDSVEY